MATDDHERARVLDARRRLADAARPGLPDARAFYEARRKRWPRLPDLSTNAKLGDVGRRHTVAARESVEDCTGYVEVVIAFYEVAIEALAEGDTATANQAAALGTDAEMLAVECLQLEL